MILKPSLIAISICAIIGASSASAQTQPEQKATKLNGSTGANTHITMPSVLDLESDIVDLKAQVKMLKAQVSKDEQALAASQSQSKNDEQVLAAVQAQSKTALDTANGAVSVNVNQQIQLKGIADVAYDLDILTKRFNNHKHYGMTFTQLDGKQKLMWYKTSPVAEYCKDLDGVFGLGSDPCDVPSSKFVPLPIDGEK